MLHTTFTCQNMHFHFFTHISHSFFSFWCKRKEEKRKNTQVKNAYSLKKNIFNEILRVISNSFYHTSRVLVQQLAVRQDLGINIISSFCLIFSLFSLKNEAKKGKKWEKCEEAFFRPLNGMQSTCL